MLSAPHNNMPISVLTNQQPIQGWQDAHPTFSSNFYTGYNGTAWTPTNPSTENLPTTFEAGDAFMLWFFNNTQGGSQELPLTLTSTGDVVGSDIVRGLHSAGNKWNLVGNPYGHNVSIPRLVGRENTIQAVGQVWDTSHGNDFTEAPGGWRLTSTNNNRLGVFQGMLIENINDATGIWFTNTSRSTESTTFYDADGEPDYRMIGFELSGVHSSGISTFDQAAILYFAEDATMEWDRWDVSKLTPLVYNFATISFIGERDGETRLQAQKSLPFDLAQPVEIPISFDVHEMAGDFHISTRTLSNIPSHWGILLIDDVTGEETDLRATSGHSFTVNSAAKLATSKEMMMPEFVSLKSVSEPRFRLVVGPNVATSAPISQELPSGIRLNQNYPNPFNPTTQITYELPQAADVRLDVFNVMGQRVATLVNASQNAGAHTVTFDAANLSSGVYVYRLQAGATVLTRKMTLVK